MLWIKHRVNRISDLMHVAPTQGVEIDLRSDLSQLGQLHLSHDPWSRGDSFEQWLVKFKELGISGPIILNTKEDGLEEQVMKLLAVHSITNWFFLDTALPTLIKHTRTLQRNQFAVRLSAYEPIEGLKPFAGFAQWVWVDCFKGVPMDAAIVASLKRDFKICLVSPELQGVDLDSQLTNFSDLFKVADAVCTKMPENWEAFTSKSKSI